MPKHPTPTKTVSSRAEQAELKAARTRIEELEAREAKRARAEQVQAALYRIAETASAATDMPSFYTAIHEIVGGLMYADNFYIALYDEARQSINHPFFLDEVDPEPPDPNAWFPFSTLEGQGITAYILQRGKPVHVTGAQIAKMAARGELASLGSVAVDYVGVPLRAD